MRHDPSRDTVRYVKWRLVSGGSWVIGARGATVLLGLTLHGLLARLLPPREMGIYFLAFSLARLLSVVAQMGFPQTTVRLVAEAMAKNQPANARAIVRLVFLCVGLTAVVTGLALASPGGDWIARQMFASPELRAIISIIAVWVVGITIQMLLAETFRGLHDLRLASLSGGLLTNLSAVLLLAGLLLYRGGADLRQAIALSIIASIITICFAGNLLVRKVATLPRGGKVDLGLILGVAWPLVLSNVGLIALTQGGIWITGATLSPEDTALYGAATRLVLLFAVPVALSNAILAPLIVELYVKQKRAAMQHILRTVATLISVPTLLAITLFTVVPEHVLRMAFGTTYQAAAPALAILCVGSFIQAIVGTAGITLITTGHQRILMTITVVFGLFVITLGPWATTGFGLFGMAALSSCALAGANISFWLAARFTSGVWTHPYVTIRAIRRGQAVFALSEHNGEGSRLA